MARFQAAEPAAPPAAMLPAPYRVAARRQETHDAWSLELSPDAAALPPFAPGQFAMLYALGIGEVPISISGGLGGPGPLGLTVRALGAATAAICESAVGAPLGVRGPFGSAWPLAAARGRDVVLVAGGIGLAPLRPVIHHVLADRASYGDLVLLYGARSPEEMLYREELEGWLARSDATAEVTVDAAPRGWRGRVGVVPGLIAEAPFDPASAVAMICGPEVMMRFAVDALRNRGMPEQSIYVSLERSMKCAVAHCGHCQLGPFFVCREGPVFDQRAVAGWLRVREL